LAGKATSRRIRRLGLNPESVGERPHLSGARGVGQLFCLLGYPASNLFKKLSAFSFICFELNFYGIIFQARVLGMARLLGHIHA
jgi:hypothetical protein